MIRMGIDIVDVDRIKRVMEQLPRFVDRVFTKAEQSYCLSKPRPHEHLAARFAAKEATFKAIGSGWPHLSWHDVEVSRENGGPPNLEIRGRALELAGACSPKVSLAHDGGMAIAEVLLVSRPPFSTNFVSWVEPFGLDLHLTGGTHFVLPPGPPRSWEDPDH
jgi:holo-[acyl-carrier protein] synthase